MHSFTFIVMLFTNNAYESLSKENFSPKFERINITKSTTAIYPSYRMLNHTHQKTLNISPTLSKLTLSQPFHSDLPVRTFSAMVSSSQRFEVSTTVTRSRRIKPSREPNTTKVTTQHKDLAMVTYIGSIFPAATCFLFILTLLCYYRKFLYNTDMFVHINVGLTITCSNIMGVIAHDATINTNQYACVGMVIGMMYFYMTTLFWILIEAIHIHIGIVEKDCGKKTLVFYFLAGWLMPAIIVSAISLLLYKPLLRQHLCWLTYDGIIIWVFVGICSLLVLTTIVIIYRSLRSSRKHFDDIHLNDKEVSRYHKMGKLLAFVLPFIIMDLVFSLLSVNEKNVIYQYCFMGINLFFGSIAILLCWLLCTRETGTETSVPVEYHNSSRPSVGNTLDITTTDPRLISLNTIRDTVQQTSTNL